MKIKLTSDLRAATAKVLACAQELRRIDEAIAKTKNAEPALRADLESTKRRLADSDAATALDGVASDDRAVTAWRDASEAIERAAGKLTGLQDRRDESVEKLRGMVDAFEVARASFAQTFKAAIESEIKPLVAALRAAYAQVTGLNEALDQPADLELILYTTKLPGVLDLTVDLLRFESGQSGQFMGAQHTDPQALELKQVLAEVTQAAAVLRAAA